MQSLYTTNRVTLYLMGTHWKSNSVRRRYIEMLLTVNATAKMLVYPDVFIYINKRDEIKIIPAVLNQNNLFKQTLLFFYTFSSWLNARHGIENYS